MRDLFKTTKHIELDEDIEALTSFMVLKKKLRNFDV